MNLIETKLQRMRLSETKLRKVKFYHDVSVYPSASELIQPGKYPLEKNIAEGPYKDINHYLSTHFFLLREDFIKPIRDDFCLFKSNIKTRLFNIKVHEVQFIRRGVKNENECLCVEIKKSLTENGRKISENNKRFMMGSLLIFSKDNFKTIFCGRVADNRNILHRKLLVTFEKFIDVITTKSYLMIECRTFFEPYYHILKVIQSRKTTLSMSKYLIDVNCSVDMPAYLKRTKYAFSPKKLNESQVIAMKAALSEELVIIQGPPGTGKTYLALKIARQLLSISDKWYRDGPMLIISFTNHALDQFLEGLLDSTDRILRSGGQSRNPKMKKYSLRECRFRFYETHKNTRDMKRRMAGLFKEFRGVEQKISSIGNQLENINTSRPSCIFYFNVLADGVPEIRNWFRNGNTGEIVSWLLECDGTMGEEQVCDRFVEDAKVMAMIYNNYLKNAHKGSKYCMLSISIMEKTLLNLYNKIVDLDNTIKIKRDASGKSIFKRFIKEKKKELKELTKIYNYLLKRRDYFKLCLSKSFNTILERDKIWQSEPFKMPVRVRWQLYQYWLSKYKIYLNEKLDDMIDEKYMPIYDEFDEAQLESTLMVMRHQKIIGMTTTMAARMHSVIKALKCPIVIVEEAAEVLEAHIIPVLTEHCQHLILIGDHLQLKPTTADYSLETNYNLGISLFERMVRNNIQCYTLNVQHRMRPEISSLITPSIYSVLHNHESVEKFPKISGMQKCLYFITHENQEQGVADSSKKNPYEAKFLIQLAVHLLKNNYQPENITILAAYLGQVSTLMQEQKLHPYDIVKNVKITSVDNFQGEENKIILLSLVRNNSDNSIGFLSIENRVCVALSRAKEGMYIMGNMDLLAKSSKLWRQIRTTLEGHNSLGKTLPLKCSQHGQITKILLPEDFDLLVSKGGCNKLCGFTLSCGHKCMDQCHTYDLNHTKYRCTQPCKRNLCSEPSHVCFKLCYQPCGMCANELPAKLPCSHHMRCFMEDLNDYRCLETVYVKLSCGHKREIQCNEVDSDFDEDLNCTFCSSAVNSDKKNISLDSVLESKLKEIDDKISKLNLSTSLSEVSDSDSDFDIELLEKPKDYRTEEKLNFF